MKSFVKGRFGRKSKGSRRLEHPRDLMRGDMIGLNDSFALPPELRGKPFRVVGVNTYQFEHEFDTSFTLESDTDERIDLIVENDSGLERLAISMTIERDVVGTLFDLDEFAKVFDGDEPAALVLLPGAGCERWVTDRYHQVAQAERGYYYEKDYRATRPPGDEGEGEPFDYFQLVSEGGEHALEIEVFGDGETEVIVTIYRPVDDIHDLWPSAE